MLTTAANQTGDTKMNAEQTFTIRLNAAQDAMDAASATCTKLSHASEAVDKAVKKAAAFQMWLESTSAVNTDPNRAHSIAHTLYHMRMVMETITTAATEAKATKKVAQQAFEHAAESFETLAGWRI